VYLLSITTGKTFYIHIPMGTISLSLGNNLLYIHTIIFEVLLQIHGKLCVSFNLPNYGKQHHHWVMLGNCRAGPAGVLPHI
jgi:hypothetical protein